MLPRIAAVDREFEDAFRSYVQILSRRSPVLRDIRTHVIHEGIANTTQRSPIDSERTKMVEARAETIMPFDEIESVDLKYIYEKAVEIAKQFEGHFSRTLFDTMREVTQQTGQTVEGGGKPLTNDVIIDLLSKMQINFEKSEHGDITIVAAPGMVPTFQRLAQEMEDNPVIQRKWDAVMERKRNEFREREINRSLVG